MTSVAPEDGPSRSEEDRRLLIRYHRHGDQAAREQLVAAPAAAGAADGAPLPALGRAARRPDPGRHARADQGDRPLRPGARDRVLLLRRADDARRAQALLPRQRLGRARPARDAGARDAGRQRGQGPLAQARALAVGGRGRRAARALDGAGARGDGGGLGLRRRVARVLPLRRRGRRRDLRRVDRRRGRALRARRVRRHDRADAAGAAGRATASCCTCASSRT